ncbi:cytochrome c biogenesis protein CcsA [bacterium SCSIO 12643]|nr:cytochrome c biogenesis protein CcsA [bacterium SCSIO 12643]
MKSIFKQLWGFFISMEFMAFLILLFAVSIGAATFIENDFGTPASKAIVYNAKWFELMLFFLFINLVANIFRYKMYKVSKWPIFMFHLAFIFMIAGGAVTRYISEEGLLHIREGKASNAVVSDKTYFRFKVDDRKMQYSFDQAVFLNPLHNPGFSNSFTFNDKDIRVTYKDYIQNAVDTVVPDENGSTFLELVTTDGQGRKTNYLEEGKTTNFGFVTVKFGEGNSNDGLRIFRDSNGLSFISPYEVSYLKMADRSQGVLSADTVHPFESRRLYQINGVSIVFKGLHEKVRKDITTFKGGNAAQGTDVLIVDLEIDGKHRDVKIKGGAGRVLPPELIETDGLYFSLAYGSKYIHLPFYIQLRDFQLDRYPGSMSPSSYASEITLIDEEQDIHEEHRIYMNHVLDHRGYRLFQSSYDQDEGGTVLSVNRDFWGTWLSYIGYILMGVGMFFTLFIQDSRFSKLSKKLDKIRIQKEALTLVVAFVIGVGGVFAQHTDSLVVPKTVPIEQAEMFGRLQIQDQGGRMKPMNTLSSEVLRKVARKSNFNGLTPDQVLLGMIYDPQPWQVSKMIKVFHPQLKKKLGMEEDEKYASFIRFFDEKFQYVLTEDIAEANRKKPSERSKYDNDVITVDERVNICYMIYTGSLMRIFPLPNDPTNKWYAPGDAVNVFKGNDSLFVAGILPMYFSALDQGQETGNWEAATKTIQSINKYQQKMGAEVVISNQKLNYEIFYNKARIFNNLFFYYFTIGLIFLILLFVQLFSNDSKVLNGVIKVFNWLIILGFSVHTLGLVLLWYISGHAPWSNAYESMVYIAWATILSGFIFSKNSKITLAATSLLTAFILMVAHLNWLDPEITNLVPVLDSYWLMIHVAIITASYGFLALGALLGLFNLILIITAPRGIQKIQLTFKELTTINEMTITIGLFMLTVGTFLGGVWANESWGRYWGWDAKETWALASVLVYSFVAHMRFIPGLRGGFAYNFTTLVSFSSIIMTYFGVNYYLSGLHSYAAGDPVPIPSFVYYTIVIVAIISIVANRRWSSFNAGKEAKS